MSHNKFRQKFPDVTLPKVPKFKIDEKKVYSSRFHFDSSGQ
jgi:hypothetical protein